MKNAFLLLIFAFCALFAGCAANNTAKKGAAEAQPGIQEPKVAEFIIGAGDTLSIEVYRHDDLKKTIKVDSSGLIMFPLIGDVKVSDKSIFALRDEIRTRLGRYVVDPQITIYVSTVQSQKIAVLGEVRSPGIFTLETDTSAMDAISKAGGMTTDAKLEKVFLLRRSNGTSQGSLINLSKAVKNGDISEDVRLRNGDILYVPAVAVADVSWYFSHLGKIVSPIVTLESGIVLWPQAKDVLMGRDRTTTPLSIPAQ